MNGLDPLIWKWFQDRFGKPTEVQKQAVPNILKGKNVLISSPTGTGKTLAAFTGIMSNLISGKRSEGITCVYISPLRALNRDIQRNLAGPLEEVYELAKKKGKHLPEITIGIRTSDTSNYEKSKMLKKPPDILITTPESFSIALATEKFSKHLKNVQYIIVDEIHELCSGKRGVELSLSMERLENLVGKRVIRIGISATIAPISEVSSYLGGFEKGKSRPVTIVDAGLTKKKDLDILLPTEDFGVSTAKQVWEGTLEQIKGLIETHDATLVFCNTRKLTERMANDLTKLGVEGVRPHHGSLSKEQRQEVEDGLRTGLYRSVVCSTSLELGIDIGKVDLVIQIGSPKAIYKLVQRFGRAGHQLGGVAKGRMIPQTTSELLECTASLSAIQAGKLDTVTIPTNCLDVLCQGLLGLSLQGPITTDDAYIVIRNSHCYHKLTKKDFKNSLEFMSGRKNGMFARLHIEAKTNTIIPRKGSRFLYFLNCGTIPPEMSYRVMNIDDNTFIGTLSQDFGLMLKDFDIFLLAGLPLQVVSFSGQSIFVRKAIGREPTVPNWQSEVPSRSTEMSSFVQDILPLTSPQAISKKASISETSARRLDKFLRFQRETAPGLGTGILVEGLIGDSGMAAVMIHTFAGRKVNNTLANVLNHAIRKRFGKTAQSLVSDDLVMLTHRGMIPLKDLMDSVDLKEVEQVILDHYLGSEQFRQGFRLNSQRSFLVLKRSSARGESRSRYRLCMRVLNSMDEKEFKTNLVVQETVREAKETSFDIQGTKQLIRDIQKGTTKVYVRNYSKDPTPFATAFLKRGAWDRLTQEPGKVRSLGEFGADDPLFKKNELSKYFKGKPSKDLITLLSNLGPQTFDELTEALSVEQEALLDELYIRIESGEVSSGFFKPSRSRVQYMLNSDKVRILLNRAGKKGTLINRNAFEQYHLDSKLDLKKLIMVQTERSFFSRNLRKKYQDEMNDGLIFQVRAGENFVLVHKDNLPIITGALRTRDISPSQRKLLKRIPSNGVPLNQASTFLELTGKALTDVLETFYSSLFLVKGARRSKTGEMVELLIPNPVKLPPERESSFTQLVESLVTGYGALGAEELEAFTGEPNTKKFAEKLVKAKILENGFLVGDEPKEVYLPKEPVLPTEPSEKTNSRYPSPFTSDHINIVPSDDPVRTLHPKTSGPSWSIYYNGRHAGGFHGKLNPDMFEVENLWLEPSIHLSLDKHNLTKFFEGVLSELIKINDQFPSGLVVVRDIGGSAPSRALEEYCGVHTLAGYESHFESLVHGQVWGRSFDRTDLLPMIFRSQLVPGGLDHPATLLAKQGQIQKAPELLLRLGERYYRFDPKNPKSRRIPFYSLEEVAKMEGLFKTYDLSGNAVFATKEWAGLIKAVKAPRVHRNQEKVLAYIPRDSSLDYKRLERSVNLDPAKAKKIVSGLKKDGHILENGYKNLVLNDTSNIKRPEAIKKIVQTLFDNFLIFNLKTLREFLGNRVGEEELVILLRTMEQDNQLVKGFLLTGSSAIHWIKKDIIPTIGNVHTGSLFILTPDDPLSTYLKKMIKERFGTTRVFTIFRGIKPIGAFKGRLTKQNIVIKEVIGIPAIELRPLVEDFSDLNTLRSFKSQEAFKHYTKVKRIRRDLHNEYGTYDPDDYLEEYDSYFGDMGTEDEEEFLEEFLLFSELG